MVINLKVRYRRSIYTEDNVTFSFERNNNLTQKDDIVQIYYSKSSMFFFTGIANKRRMGQIN